MYPDRYAAHGCVPTPEKMTKTMERKKTIALVAHDNTKPDLVEWVEWNHELLMCHRMVCTGTTGRLVEKVLRKHAKDDDCILEITLLKSGPLGGDQQLGSMIAEGRIDALMFFWDPMEAQPHDVDVKALLRIATLYNVPTAINRSSADFMVSSPLFTSSYVPFVKDYKSYVNRKL